MGAPVFPKDHAYHFMVTVRSNKELPPDERTILGLEIAAAARKAVMEWDREAGVGFAPFSDEAWDAIYKPDRPEDFFATVRSYFTSKTPPPGKQAR